MDLGNHHYRHFSYCWSHSYSQINCKKNATPKKRQLDILRERLAKGEITQEEYDKLKKEFE